MKMKATELMSHPVRTVAEATSLQETAIFMLENGIGCVPVVDNAGKISGIITESSFTAKSKGIPFSTFRAPQLLGRWISDDGVEKIYAAARNTPVSEIMSSPVVTVNEDDTVNRVVELMLKHDINRVPVVRDGVPIGIVARHDLLRLLAANEA
jgi:CBS domain-containing protein